MDTPSRTLSPLARSLWLTANLALGLLPGFLFFAWIERNCSLPWSWLGENIRWPWIYLPELSTPQLAAFDIALFLAFGAIHSATAQQGFQRALSARVPEQAVRTVYLVITGASAIAVMGLWQSTGVILWALPLSPATNAALSLALFWGFLALCGKVAQQFDVRHFFGWKQLHAAAGSRPSGNEQLQTTGFYAWVRHPIYTLSFLAFLVTPFMSLDRMLVTVAMALYLIVGIPLEERKLVQLFGESYLGYRSRVPAVFPRLKKA